MWADSRFLSHAFGGDTRVYGKHRRSGNRGYQARPVDAMLAQQSLASIGN